MVCIVFNKGGNSLPKHFERTANIRSKCFPETKQTQNEVGRFSYNLAEFVFEYFRDSWRILATFAKFCLNSLFATWSYRYPNPKHSSSARSRSLPSTTQVCTLWLCGSIVANPIIYWLVPSPSRFENRQWQAVEGEGSQNERGTEKEREPPALRALVFPLSLNPLRTLDACKAG